MLESWKCRSRELRSATVSRDEQWSGWSVPRTAFSWRNHRFMCSMVFAVMLQLPGSGGDDG